MKPPLTFVEGRKPGSDEPPIRLRYRLANIIVELVTVCIIALVAGYVFTGSAEGSIRVTSPMIAAYFILDIILLIRKGRTGFMRVKIFR